MQSCSNDRVKFSVKILFSKVMKSSLNLFVLHADTESAARWELEKFFRQDKPVIKKDFRYFKKCLPVIQSLERSLGL